MIEDWLPVQFDIGAVKFRNSTLPNSDKDLSSGHVDLMCNFEISYIGHDLYSETSMRLQP